jgi:hypothetical protein
MKRIIPKLFNETTFISINDGTLRMYEADDGLMEILGQATSIRVHGFVYEKTDANATAELKFYESSVGGDVVEKGAQIGSAVDLSAVGATFGTVSGPFCGRVKAILEVSDATTTSGKKFHMDIGLTLILES